MDGDWDSILKSRPLLPNGERDQHEYFFHSVHLNEIELLYCGYEHCRPGHWYGPTMRDHFYFHFILSGKGIFHSDRDYLVPAGSGFIGLPYQVIYYEADRKEPWTYLWVGAKGEMIQSLFSRAAELTRYPIITHNSPDRIYTIMKDFLASVQDYSLSSYLHAVGNFLDLLAALYNDTSRSLNRQHLGRSNRSKTYVEKAKDFIQNNYCKDISMETIAQYVGINEDYLARLFKRELNTTPASFLRMYRVELAYKMLLNTDMSVQEIAAAVGFADAQYFSRCFTQRYGDSPRELRKRSR